MMWACGCDYPLPGLHHEDWLTQSVTTTVLLTPVTQGAVPFSLNKFQQTEINTSHFQLINIL